MRQVVFDTNIFLSAFIFGGKPAEVFELARSNKIQLLTSSAILAEFASRLKNKFEWNEEDIVKALKTVGYSSKLIKPASRLKVIADDPDNRILECALDGNADFIISGDHHLLDLKSYEKIKIVKASAILEIF